MRQFASDYPLWNSVSCSPLMWASRTNKGKLITILRTEKEKRCCRGFALYTPLNCPDICSRSELGWVYALCLVRKVKQTLSVSNAKRLWLLGSSVPALFSIGVSWSSLQVRYWDDFCNIIQGPATQKHLYVIVHGDCTLGNCCLVLQQMGQWWKCQHGM